MSATDWSDVLRHVKAYFPAVAVVAAMRLELFTALADGPRTAEELAATLGVPTRRLRMLVRSLVAAKLVVSDGDCFANAPVAAEFLVKGHPQYMGGSHELYSHMFSSVLSTAESIRTGVPQAIQDWTHMPDDRLRAILRGLNPGRSHKAGRSPTLTTSLASRRSWTWEAVGADSPSEPVRSAPA
jgi:hypothetical protein